MIFINSFEFYYSSNPTNLCYNYFSFKFQKMARNCEKAQGMLNRWWTMKRSLVNKEEDERPKGLRHIREINDMLEC